MILKLLQNVLFALNVLYVINANENEVHFDFNKYFKVNIATNKPTVLPVTLYNPDIWPGPNDTHPTTTPQPLPKPQKRRFAFGLRRSPVEYRNKGYGYENNITHHIKSPPYETTISPYNRKFYNIDFNHINNNNNNYNNNTNIYPQNITEFRGYRYLPPNIHISRNYSNRFLTGYIPRRNITRKRPIIYRNVTKKPTKWQVFKEEPRYIYNFSRDLGDFQNFQDIVREDISKWRNISNDFNLSNINQTANTSFRCEQMSYFGYFADIETNCRTFHICTPDGRKVTFECPQRLRFNQELTVCDWRRNVVCRQSPNFFDINLIKFDHWNKPLLFKK